MANLSRSDTLRLVLYDVRIKLNTHTLSLVRALRLFLKCFTSRMPISLIAVYQ